MINIVAWISLAIGAWSYFCVVVGMKMLNGCIKLLQRENAELILRLDAIDAAAITAGVTLRDLRTELNEAVGGSLTGDDMSVFIETAMKAVHDRLLLLERAREDNKGPVQARGVVASRRAIMEMGGAKDLNGLS